MAFNCDSYANDINASPDTITCANQNACTDTECCTVVPGCDTHIDNAACNTAGCSWGANLCSDAASTNAKCNSIATTNVFHVLDNVQDFQVSWL